jgi:pyruvate kinase
MADLQGPKIRIGKFAGQGHAQAGRRLHPRCALRTGRPRRVGLDYKDLRRRQAGDVLLLDDGRIVLDVTGHRREIRCKVRHAASCPTTRASTARAAA